MKINIRKLIILVLGIFSGIILILTTDDINWILDEIVAVVISIIFITPLITSMFDMQYPKEYIVVFVIGGIIFASYAFLFYSTIAEVLGMLFKVILFSAISTFAVIFIRKLEDIIPP